MRPFLRVAWLAASDRKSGSGDALRRYVRLIGQCPEARETTVFELATPGAEQQAIIDTMASMGRAMKVGEALRMKPDILVFTELDTLDSGLALQRHLEDRPGKTAVDGLLVVAHGLYREVTYTAGPDVDKAPHTGIGPAIQFGLFDMRSEEDEWEINEWYRTRRLVSISTLPGAIRARRYVSVAGGPAKSGILYEFVSLAARIEHFEPMNSRDHELDAPAPGSDGTVNPRLIADRTVHPPMSPSIGVAVAID
jgi:hypothetical protein